MKNPVAFMRQVKEEARKTTWPTKKEVVMTSLFVFCFTLIMALFFLGVDSVFVRIVSALMGI
ncbi:MAG: preprotein translocase subunit SecE [Alphaproteobacteria bacterium]|nr:preprotein translocase subunit SecE [Alphaproteobacteria bacterium]